MQEILASTCKAPSTTDTSQCHLDFQGGVAKIRQGVKDAAQMFFNTGKELQKLAETFQEVADTKLQLADAFEPSAYRTQDSISTGWELVAPGTSSLTSHSSIMLMPATGPKDVKNLQQDAGSVTDTHGWTWPQQQDWTQHVPSSQDYPAPLSSEKLPDCWTEVCEADREGDFTKEVVREAMRGGCVGKVQLTYEDIYRQDQGSAAQPYVDPLMLVSSYL